MCEGALLGLDVDLSPFLPVSNNNSLTNDLDKQQKQMRRRSYSWAPDLISQVQFSIASMLS